MKTKFIKKKKKESPARENGREGGREIGRRLFALCCKIEKCDSYWTTGFRG